MNGLTMFVLPRELLLTVFSFLSSPDIQNLRLVCREYHHCASQYLVRTLRIASDPTILQLWKRISANDLFRRGVSRAIYHTTRTHSQPANFDDGVGKRKVPNTVTRFGLEVGHCYDVYDVLSASLSQLPRIEEVMITDQYLPAQLEDMCAINWDIDRGRSHPNLCEDSCLGVFVFLRALAEAKLRLTCFDLYIARFIPGSIQRSQYYEFSIERKLPTFLFQSCVITAAEVFKSLRELSISTRGPDPESCTSHLTKLFEGNLMALVCAAGPVLEILRLSVKDMSIPSEDSNYDLFSEKLLKSSCTNWPLLSSIELRGIDINSYDLITLFNHKTKLSKLSLHNVYLTPRSQVWTDILDHLCVVLKVHRIEAVDAERRRTKERGGSTERIEINLDHVFEPWDVELHAGLTLTPEDCLGFFEGREGNPLRVSYENFLCRNLG